MVNLGSRRLDERLAAGEPAIKITDGDVVAQGGAGPVTAAALIKQMFFDRLGDPSRPLNIRGNLEGKPGGDRSVSRTSPGLSARPSSVAKSSTTAAVRRTGV